MTPNDNATRAHLASCQVARTWPARFGVASLARLQRAVACEGAFGGPLLGYQDAPQFSCRCEEVEASHVAAFGALALAREKEEDDARDLARRSDAGFVAYQKRWETKLTRLTKRYPERLSVPGLTHAEVRDMSSLRLLELVRTDDESCDVWAKPGREWGLAVVQFHVRELRRQFRLHAEPMDFREPLPVMGRESDHEERFLEMESEQCRWSAQRRAEDALTRPQRAWLAALKLAANSAEFLLRPSEST